MNLNGPTIVFEERAQATFIETPMARVQKRFVPRTHDGLYPPRRRKRSRGVKIDLQDGRHWKASRTF
jgi:hypothetical protein